MSIHKTSTPWWEHMWTPLSGLSPLAFGDGTSLMPSTTLLLPTAPWQVRRSTLLSEEIPCSSELTFVCKKIYDHQFELEKVPQDVADWIYTRVPPHTMYIGEIVDVVER